MKVYKTGHPLTVCVSVLSWVCSVSVNSAVSGGSPLVGNVTQKEQIYLEKPEVCKANISAKRFELHLNLILC